MDATAKANGTTSATKFDALSRVPAIAQPLAEEPSEIAFNISYHAHYSPHFSLFKFDPEKAYYSTADSVRDRLIKVGLLIFLEFMPLIVCKISSAHINVRK